MNKQTPPSGSKVDPQRIGFLRTCLVDYLMKIGIELRRVGGRHQGRCPFHDDSDPSFSVLPNGTQCGCYPCDWKGDVFDLSQKLGRSSTFLEAVDDVGNTIGLSDATRWPQAANFKRRLVSTKPPVRPVLPSNFEAIHREARSKLYQICKRRTEAACRLASALSTDLETLMMLTCTTDALGLRSGRLAYLYEHGIKLRNPPGSKQRFVWECGKAVHPWRWHFSQRRGVRRVYVTEGESDAIAAISAGLENLNPTESEIGSCVIACPGTSFPPAWGSLFRRKEVVLLFDADGPGRDAAIKVAGIVHPFALSVAISNWKGLAAYE